eukprot:7764367-Ditylum_brightwellii.AAC.1
MRSLSVPPRNLSKVQEHMPQYPSTALSSASHLLETPPATTNSTETCQEDEQTHSMNGFSVPGPIKENDTSFSSTDSSCDPKAHSIPFDETHHGNSIIPTASPVNKKKAIYTAKKKKLRSNVLS